MTDVGMTDFMVFKKTKEKYFMLCCEFHTISFCCNGLRVWLRKQTLSHKASSLLPHRPRTTESMMGLM
jgi:hypothetical protein